MGTELHFLRRAKPVAKTCPNKQSCQLFPLFRLRSSLQYWMEVYCDADYRRCVRYQRACEGSMPPPNILPNGKDIHKLTK